MNRPSILIVDDEPSNFDVIETLLNTHKYDQLSLFCDRENQNLVKKQKKPKLGRYTKSGLATPYIIGRLKSPLHKQSPPMRTKEERGFLCRIWYYERIQKELNESDRDPYKIFIDINTPPTAILTYKFVELFCGAGGITRRITSF